MASIPDAVAAQPAVAELPIVPRIVRRTFVDAHALLRPLALAERAASSRKGRAAGTVAVALLFAVALAAYAGVNLRPDAGWGSDAMSVRVPAPPSALGPLRPRPTLGPRLSAAAAMRR